jgi:hypothetical protein
MDERAIWDLLKRRYPEARFKVKFFPFGVGDSKVLVIRTDLYNERGEEGVEEIKNFLKRYGISEKFYRNIETGEIFAGEIAFVVVAPLEEGEGDGEVTDDSI